MAKADWGAKRRCLGCSAAFYDMRKDPIVCPKCGTVHQPEQILKPRRRVEEVKQPKAAVDEIDVPALEEDDDGADDNVLEDASDLGGDDADMAEVIEGADGDQTVEER